MIVKNGSRRVSEGFGNPFFGEGASPAPAPTPATHPLHTFTSTITKTPQGPQALDESKTKSFGLRNSNGPSAEISSAAELEAKEPQTDEETA